MMSAPHRRRRDDKGEALIFAILFITVFALIVGVILDGTGVNLQAERVSQERTGIMYADDAAIEAAITYLRANTTGTTCGTSSLAWTDLSSTLGANFLPNLDSQPPGSTVTTIECRDLAGNGGAKGPLQGFVAISTSTAASVRAITDQSGGSPAIEGGNVYNRNDKWDLKSSLSVSNGNVYAGTCPPGSPSTQSNLTLISPSQRLCGASLTLPKIVQPSSAPSCAPYWDTPSNTWISESLSGTGNNQHCVTAGNKNIDANMNGGVISGCQVFMPGRYEAAPMLLKSTNAYFASGLYYFDYNGSWTLNNVTSMFGGEPGSDTVEMEDKSIVGASHVATPCPQTDLGGKADGSDWDVKAQQGSSVPNVTGTGVDFVFAGPSVFSVGNNAYMEFFTRSGPASEGTAAINIQEATPAAALTTDSEGVWSSATPTAADFIGAPQAAPTQGNLAFNQGGGSQVFDLVHGAIYMPNSEVSIFATNNGVGAVEDGVDAYVIALQSTASGNGLVIGSKTGTANRVIQIEAEGGAPSDGTKVKRSAIVQITNDANNNFPTSVISWRSCEVTDTDCPT